MKLFKYIACFLALLFLLSFVGCTDSQEQEEPLPSSEQTESFTETQETTAIQSVTEESHETTTAATSEPDAQSVECPWNEPGAKQISDYTWDEYQALTDVQREVFFESFESPEEYDLWLRKAQGSDLYPWEEEGRNVSDYSWEEYEALSEEEKGLFQMCFEDIMAFDNWLTSAQSRMLLPWEKDGKAPADYTWEEYEALSDYLKDAFFESFDDPQALDTWIANNMPE